MVMNIEIGPYLIRDWREDDAPSVAKYANNRKIWMSLRDEFPHPYTLPMAEAFLSHVIKAEPRTVFAVASRTEAIGSIGFLLGQDVHRLTAELGYWLAEPFWGKGIMTSAAKAVTDYGFSFFGLNRVFAGPYATNAASARVLEKAGFEREGILRASVVKEGRVLDQFLYAKVRDGIS
jgi:RimJ/RimL family protein N-acetyltransferase